MKTNNYELYLHPKQKDGWISGHELYAHLKETGILEECASKDDEIVKDWLANPNTYPKEFKGKWIYLWKSVEDRDGHLSVPCLDEYGGEVVLGWFWLDGRWDAGGPALRFRKSSPKSLEPKKSDLKSLELRIERLEKWAKQLAPPEL